MPRVTEVDEIDDDDVNDHVSPAVRLMSSVSLELGSRMTRLKLLEYCMFVCTYIFCLYFLSRAILERKGGTLRRWREKEGNDIPKKKGGGGWKEKESNRDKVCRNDRGMKNQAFSSVNCLVGSWDFESSSSSYQLTDGSYEPSSINQQKEAYILRIFPW